MASSSWKTSSKGKGASTGWLIRISRISRSESFSSTSAFPKQGSQARKLDFGSFGPLTFRLGLLTFCFGPLTFRLGPLAFGFGAGFGSLCALAFGLRTLAFRLGLLAFRFGAGFGGLLQLPLGGDEAAVGMEEAHPGGVLVLIKAVPETELHAELLAPNPPLGVGGDRLIEVASQAEAFEDAG